MTPRRDRFSPRKRPKAREADAHTAKAEEAARHPEPADRAHNMTSSKTAARQARRRYRSQPAWHNLKAAAEAFDLWAQSQPGPKLSRTQARQLSIAELQTNGTEASAADRLKPQGMDDRSNKHSTHPPTSGIVVTTGHYHTRTGSTNTQRTHMPACHIRLTRMGGRPTPRGTLAVCVPPNEISRSDLGERS